jgi:hypothetical protein
VGATALIQSEPKQQISALVGVTFSGHADNYAQNQQFAPVTTSATFFDALLI